MDANDEYDAYAAEQCQGHRDHSDRRERHSRIASKRFSLKAAESRRSRGRH